MTRVAVTTDRAEEVMPVFSDAGLDPVSLPCIRVGAGPAAVVVSAREAAERADLVLIGSIRAVGALWPDGSLPAVDMAAVGPATAAAIRDRGGIVAYAGKGGLADLAADIGSRFATSSVVFPHAANTPQANLDLLRSVCGRLESFPVYQTNPIPPALDSVEAAAFASPTAVQGWLLSRTLDGLVIGAIGATTAAEIAGHRPPDVVAEEPGFPSLAAALGRFLETSVR